MLSAASTASDRGTQPLCIAACGCKGAGKSTLARLLVNSLLNCHHQVALLDTDCGQPELTPPGGTCTPACR